MAQFLSPRAQGCLSWSNTGYPRFLGNPSHTSAPLSDPGRPVIASPLWQHGAVPRHLTLKTPTLAISRLNHAALISAAYASSSALPCSHARLASSWWLAFTGRESNPLDCYERFPLSPPPFLGLAWRYKGTLRRAAKQQPALDPAPRRKFECWRAPTVGQFS